MFDHQHRTTGVLADPQQQRSQRLGLLLGDAAGRLVEHQHLGILREDAREVDDPAAAGGQLARELLPERAEPHELDQLIDLLPHRQLRLVGSGQLEGGSDHLARRDVTLAGDRNRLGDCERRVQERVLERAPE